jgi:peptide/nickel transport system permease protein
VKRVLALLWRGKAARAALVFIGAICAAAILLPPLLEAAGIDPYVIDADSIYLSPSVRHLFGTDDLGRDAFARILIGARVSLAVSILGTGLSVAIGSAIGLASGWFGGIFDAIASRVTEAMMAIPRLPLMLIFAAVDLDKVFPLGLGMFGRGSSGSIVKLVFIVVLFGWMGAARLSRASALELRRAEFVEAARALGASARHVILRHVLPNAAAPLATLAAIELGEIILYESVISFLGLGVAPPLPSWGQMLAKGMTYLESAPLLLIMPGLLTFLTVLSFNVLADRVRDALDPRTAEPV